MPDVQPILVPRAPFADLPVARTVGRGFIVSVRDGLGLATVLARKGKSAALTQRLREHFGIELPQGPHRTTAGDLALAGTGPGAWLATRDRGGNAFAESLMRTIGDLASVSDQSDGYAVLRLAGPKVGDTLCKLVPIDVHPRAFKIADVAATVAAHIGATLWRLEDGADGSPVFEIAIYRSYAANLWRALTCSCTKPKEKPAARDLGTNTNPRSSSSQGRVG
jgi:heterotetrameric sarcosine oxidase gamma subunit